VANPSLCTRNWLIHFSLERMDLLESLFQSYGQNPWNERISPSCSKLLSRGWPWTPASCIRTRSAWGRAASPRMCWGCPVFTGALSGAPDLASGCLCYNAVSSGSAGSEAVVVVMGPHVPPPALYSAASIYLHTNLSSPLAATTLRNVPTFMRC